MARNRDEEKLELEIQVMIAQYQQCFEHLRQHDAFIWQIPSVLVLLCSGIMVAAYRFLPDEFWLVRAVLLLLGGFMSLALSYSLGRHRYYQEIEIRTLSAIEKALMEKGLTSVRLVRTIRPMFGLGEEPLHEEYYVDVSPPRLLKWSGFKFLMLVSVITTISLFGLSIHSVWPGLNDPSWWPLSSAVMVISLVAISFSLVVFSDILLEKRRARKSKN